MGDVSTSGTRCDIATGWGTIRGALENISTALDHSDLVRIAARLNLAHVGSLDPRETLLREIAMCISNGDGEFAESVVEAKSEEQSENLLAQDPIVAKVFEEADDEDKKEFDDMGKAMMRQKKAATGESQCR